MQKLLSEVHDNSTGSSFPNLNFYVDVKKKNIRVTLFYVRVFKFLSGRGLAHFKACKTAKYKVELL